ncbi:hypothetical protein HPB47_024022, partial [Ixodes persulcatus]
VSYPRSGTHWVQQIIQLILSRGESVETFAEFMERAPYLEVQELKETQSFPRLLRTHFPMNKLRISEKAKYIYVARNPWDTCVSCYHLIRECPPCNFANGTFDDFLDAFIDAQTVYQVTGSSPIPAISASSVDARTDKVKRLFHSRIFGEIDLKSV